MTKLAIVAILALLSAGAMFSFSHLMQKNRVVANSTTDVAFNTRLNTQNKMYASPAENVYRSTVFAANYQKVAQDNQVFTHISALNQFADLTEEEFISKYTGLNYQADTPKNYVTLESSNQGAGVDWRSKGAVNAVKDQGQCGSCWAFSAASALESSWFLAHGTLYDLSEQQLVDCATTTGNQGCNGGFMDYAFKYIQLFGGLEQTSDYPYTAQDNTCKAVKTATKANLKGWTDVPQNNCAQLLTALNTQPVSVAIAANAIMSYSSGVFANANCGTGLNHGVTAVGYGTDGGQDYFIVRNSWGAGWGEKGYIRMSRTVQVASGICGICMAASYPQAA
jgi:xylem cysteine proteinase